VLATNDIAEWHAKRDSERRETAFVGGLASFEQLNRARKNLSYSRKLEDAIAARKTKPAKARGERFDRIARMMPVAALLPAGQRMLRHHRLALRHQNAASIAYEIDARRQTQAKRT